MSHKTIEELNKIAEDELAKIQGKELTNKDRMAIPQQEMPSREPKERARQMAEVALGYTEAQAVVEANRCLQCKNMPCINGCPVGVKIPETIPPMIITGIMIANKPSRIAFPRSAQVYFFPPRIPYFFA